jgi:putative DNA primase/helicase
MSAADSVAAFSAALADAGLSTAEPIVADGALHRLHLDGDRRGSRNAWYVLHPDPPVSGAFGCWRRGVSGTWSAAGADRLTREDRELIRRRTARMRAERTRVREREQHTAARRAAELWEAAGPARADHPYLRAKGITAGIACQQGTLLVLPVVDLDGELHSLQFIGPDGEKRLLTGGRKKGCFIPAGGTVDGASRILLCEGFATGRTLVEMEPDSCVLAAVDAGNLEPVAVAVRERWPRAEIVVCADADPVGLQKGRAAAIAAGALVAVPSFPDGVEGSDWNDLANTLREVAA